MKKYTNRGDLLKMNIEYFLSKSPEELKDIALKNEIINNSNKYIFIWFCQRASKEQVEMLMDDEGVILLSKANDLRDKLNGILTSETKFNMCANETFCRMVLDNDMIPYTGPLNKDAALSFYKYVCEHNADEIMDVFYNYYGSNQIEILQNTTFEPEIKLSILKSCRKEAAEFLLNRDTLDLSELSVNDIERLLEKKIVIPEKNRTPQFLDKIASIHDVNRYRLLMNKLEENIDISDIEAARRKRYERELATINEEGLLEKFQVLKDKIKSGEVSAFNIESIKSIEGFNGSEDLIHRALFSKDLDETIKK